MASGAIRFTPEMLSVGAATLRECLLLRPEAVNDPAIEMVVARIFTRMVRVAPTTVDQMDVLGRFR